MNKLHALVGGCFADLGVSMAEVGDSNSAGEVQHPPTVVILHPGTFAFHHDPLSDPANSMIDVLDPKSVQVLWWISMGVQRPALGYFEERVVL